MNNTDVLIVGAGPTGLALALFLAKQGVVPRIIDKNTGPGLESRAMVVQARTLEFYRQLGFADRVVDSGIRMRKVHIWEDGTEAATIEIGEFGEGVSPYPFALSFPQDDHERLLTEELRSAGIQVEWGTELIQFDDREDVVHATLCKAGGEESIDFKYLCGCDGARSTVRQGLNLQFAGGTYDQVFYVADVNSSGGRADQDLNLCVSNDGFCAVFPIRSTGMHRLVGVIPEALAGRENVTFEEIQPFAEKLVGVHVRSVNWFSTYHVHHRVTDHFRVGRSFVSGDAGHIHSPAGGQGMNTGIGDAVNLAWKLAAAVQGGANAEILDTYETERIAFARSLVASTDKLFQGMVGHGLGARLFRDLLPHAAPFLLGFSAVRTAAFRAVSQTRIHYHDSALSEGTAGHVQGGDRLPYIESLRNFDPLTTVDWQIHVYGEASAALHQTAADSSLALNVFSWSDCARDAGFDRDALYLIRPDGYVAFAEPDQDIEILTAYLSRFGIKSR